jgi:hypothetical protein
MVYVPVLELLKYWTQKLASAKSENHAITNKYTEAAAEVQQGHKVLSDIRNRAGCVLGEVGETSEGISAVNRAEEVSKCPSIFRLEAAF